MPYRQNRQATHVLGLSTRSMEANELQSCHSHNCENGERDTTTAKIPALLPNDTEHHKDTATSRVPTSLQSDAEHQSDDVSERAADDVYSTSYSQPRTCTECRKSKVKCDRGVPCNRCLRLRLKCIAQKRGRGRPVIPKDPDTGKRNEPRVTAPQRKLTSSTLDFSFPLNLRTDTDVPENPLKEVCGKRKRIVDPFPSQTGSVQDNVFSQFNLYYQQHLNNDLTVPAIGASLPQNGSQQHGDRMVETLVSLRGPPPYLNGSQPTLLPSLSGTQWRSQGSLSDGPVSQSGVNSQTGGLVNGTHNVHRSQELHQLQQGILSWPDLGEMMPLLDPTDTIINAFWRLNSHFEVSRPKALVVVRHWVQIALDRRSLTLLRKTLGMGQTLGFEFAQIIDDVQLLTRFHELTDLNYPQVRRSNPIPSGPLEMPLPDHIQALSSNLCAVSQRLVVRGRSRFIHNELWSELFMSGQEADKIYAANTRDIWGSVIHPNDHFEFFDGLANQLFRVPTACSDCQFVLYCVDRGGVAFPALLRYRSCFLEAGDVAAYVLTITPLPHSRHIQFTPPIVQPQPIPILPPISFEGLNSGGLPPLQDPECQYVTLNQGGKIEFSKENLEGGRRKDSTTDTKVSPVEYRRFEQIGKDSSPIKSEASYLNGKHLGYRLQNQPQQYIYHPGFDRYSTITTTTATKPTNITTCNNSVDNCYAGFSSALLSGNDLAKLDVESDTDMENVILNEVFDITGGDCSSLGLMKSGGVEGDIHGFTFDKMMRDAA